MREAWIYAGGDFSDEVVDGISALVAELGFAPRRVSTNGELRPSGDGAGAGRPPELALVIGDMELCARLDSDEHLGDVPLLVIVGADELDSTPEIHDGHELVVLPVHPPELRARISRARGRVGGVGVDEVVRHGTLELNLATYGVTVAGEPVDFTYMEYELLKFLATHPGRVFSRESLLSRVWGFDYYGGARTVDVHIRRLRAKLGSENAARIKTLRSVGYRFEKDPR